MSANHITITEQHGQFEIQNSGISEFALIGILECLLDDLKSRRRESFGRAEHPVGAPPKTVSQPETTDSAATAEINNPVESRAAESETAPLENHPAPAVQDLRTRIGNAVKAIRNLGGQAEDADLGSFTDEELQSELESLTNQYKRLKNSRGKK